MFFLTHFFCLFLAQIRFLFAKKDRNRASENIERVLGIPKDSKACAQKIRAIFYHQMMVFCEMLLESFFPGTMKWQGEEELRKRIRFLESEKRGQIIITGHVGHWEFVGHQVAKHTERQFFALAKPAKQGGVDRVLESLRKRLSMHVLWTRGSGYFKSMLRALAGGHWLGFVMDQRPPAKQGVMVEFLGHPTLFVTGPAQMALRGGHPVLGLFCVRVAPFEYRLISSTLLPSGHAETDVQKITQILASAISAVIIQYPEQWVWEYRRWFYTNHT